MRNMAFVAAVILAVVVFVGALYLVRGQTPTSIVLASPTVTAAATPAVTATPAPSPTPSPTPTGLYVNSTYKFSVILPPPYRKSLRAVNGTSTPERYQDAFTARSDAEEAVIDTSGCHTACPLWQYAAYVVVNTGTGSQTTRDWYTKEEGGTTSQAIEDTLVDGRPAIRITNGARYTMQFIIKDGDRIVVVAYQIYGPENGMAVPAGATKEKLEAILASFKFLP
jgi:hypothetical protein